jgi:hypothetical protein
LTEPNRREFVLTAAAAAAALAASQGAAAQSAVLAAHGRIAGSRLRLENDVIAAEWEASAQGLRLIEVRGRQAGPAVALGPLPVCRIALGDTVLDASQIRLVSAPRLLPLEPEPRAANLAARFAGRQLAATFADPQGRFQLLWRALLRDGSHYVRQEFTLTAGASPVPITEVTLVDLALPNVAVNGSVAGSPVTLPQPSGGAWFFAFEHPLSHSAVDSGRATALFQRALPLPPRQSATYSSVIGMARPGQLRRDFLAYIERERAHPYRAFLHYNSWFDLGYFTPYDQTGCLDVIHAFGRELVRRRRVRMDSFLFDDGWDNHRDWGFNAGFPHGFTPLKAATAAMGAAPGVWLSPWGGYGKPRQERLAAARQFGYEINRDGLALSGPVYYRRFHQVCLEMVTRYGVNQFKLDGTGSVAQVAPGSRFGSDFEAAIQLISDMRAAKPDLFVNLTTGTYPSPFWLRYADSTWRGGYDTNFAGVGTDRQQWITYRDGATYGGVVLRGPLYPLNSLMLHGIVFAKHARRLETDPGHDFAAEVRSYFSTGTQLQEMYLSHDLLSVSDWDTLAEAARWARRRAPILRDTHWIGGDPRALEVYGHAAWSPRGAVLALRNPSAKPQSIALDPADLFELPASTRLARFRLRSPFARDQWGAPAVRAAVTLEAGARHTFALRPFEVQVFEAV